MRRNSLISLFLFILCLDAFPQAQISVDCQDHWGPGRYNKVTIGIDFTIPGFARFTQDFPVGLEVVKAEAAGCDVSWSGSQLNMICMKASAGKHVDLTYYVLPYNGMNGDITMQGKVVVISERNRRHAVLMDGKTISIEGSNGLLPAEMKELTGAVTNDKQILKNKPPEVKSPNGIVYRVQLSSSSSPSASEKVRKSADLGKDVKITVVKSGSVYKYQAGEFPDAASAGKLLNDLKARGIKDVFIVKSVEKGR